MLCWFVFFALKIFIPFQHSVPDKIEDRSYQTSVEYNIPGYSGAYQESAQGDPPYDTSEYSTSTTPLPSTTTTLSASSTTSFSSTLLPGINHSTDLPQSTDWNELYSTAASSR